MAVISEFVAAINQIASERGIEKDDVIEAIEEALAVAFKRENDMRELEDVSANFDEETGRVEIFVKKNVVKGIPSNVNEISLKDAKKLDKNVKVGDVVSLRYEMGEISRIGAQIVKQVVLQKLREFEKKAVLEQYGDKVGQIFTALMQRMQAGSVVFELDKVNAYMPKEEQIPGEFYRNGERYKVLLKKIETDGVGGTLIVSRSGSDFLKGLFKAEVPEIESGVVEIMAVAREAGSRSKIAVKSNQDGIDAIGSCVGQRGVRIANIMGELGNEKIDIIEWANDPEQFVANALNPAKVESVKIKDNVATVKVPDDQLSLAIGKDGQNVRLAVKLTGFDIEIVGTDTNKGDNESQKLESEDESGESLDKDNVIKDDK